MNMYMYAIHFMCLWVCVFWLSICVHFKVPFWGEHFDTSPYGIPEVELCDNSNNVIIVIPL